MGNFPSLALPRKRTLRGNEVEAVRRLEVSYCLLAALVLFGCDQLGNPRQYATPPTTWRGPSGHLTTTTRSFRNQKTIRRLVSEGLDELDYSAPSIGPSQTLTMVDVVVRSYRASRRGRVGLVTRFVLPDGRSVARRWSVVPDHREWSAAFALPAPPAKAITAVVP